ncbi:MAG: UDP-N-acetylmuramoyl-tripeptide--D-alanyl-D-alanine ligase [Deltaproteobacteria bacterium]|nr:UDP-N-acetylmuramoyl-tripeptide--D-alanyl-D-alanine ligase [Deltaproteobacteria bacterium]
MATPIPQNGARFLPGEICEITRGRLGGAPAARATPVCGICTDTRSLLPGQAFVALRGERTDGHDHLVAAARAGAALAIVERDADPAALPLLRVDSTLEALGALAASHVRAWRGARAGRLLVAVTGSAGKTTTRAAIASVLEALRPGRVLAAAGNLNNRVGVPMTLLGLSAAHDCAVVELGTSRPGEIQALGRLCQPDVAVLTLIALAHSEGLGDLGAIAREKAALYDELVLPDAVAVGNADDERVAAALGAAPAAHRVGYGHVAQASYRIVARRPVSLDRALLQLRRPDGSEIRAEIGLVGRAGALSAAAAVAVVEAALGHRVSAELLALALAAPGPDAAHAAGRLRPRQLPGGPALLDDSYNANPASCAASIEAAAELALLLGRRLVLVLGEMRELGDASEAGHAAVGRAAARSGARLVLCVGAGAGPMAAEAALSDGRAARCADAAQAAELCRAELGPGDLVLVKGSRAVRTDLVVEALCAAYGRGEAAPVTAGGGQT